MAAPIFAGMASFADNFTKAYSGERRRQADEEEREWRNEQRGRQRKEWDKADQLEADLKDAGAERIEQQGTLTEGQAGGAMQRTFNQNPEEAQRVKSMMDAEAEMTGAAASAQQQTTAVTGNMARGHQIGQTMSAMGAEPNSPDAVSRRTAQAYRKNGFHEKALSMESAMLDQQAKRLGLNIDQLKFADMQTNRALESALKSGPTWYEGATKFVTEAQRGGIKDIKAEHQLSPDGKTVTLFAVMPDGTKQATGTYPSDESGMLKFAQKFASLPIEKRMDLMHDKIKADKEDSRWERAFGLQASQNARAEETHKIAMADAKVPAAVKMQAATLAEEMKSVSAAMNKAMADNSFDPNSANAKTLIERQAALGILYRNLMQPHMPGAKDKPAADPLGLNVPPDEQQSAATPGQPANPTPTKSVVSMGQVAPIAAPKPPTQSSAPTQSATTNRPAVSMQQAAQADSMQKPVRRVGEPLQEFKARLIQWDQARMENERVSREQASEAQRQRLLQSRPDLAQMGQGLR